MTGLTRRDFIGIAAASVIVAGGASIPFALGARGSASTGEVLQSGRALPARFVAPFRVPSLLAPSSSTADGDFYEIVQRTGTARIFPGVDTVIWGYNGTFPGPTIESVRGRTVTVRHTNQLGVPTVVHLHGGRTPADHDGYPTDFVTPRGLTMDGHPMGGTITAESRDYVYPLDQRAAQLWYHDHRMDFTGPSIWRGLAGIHFHRDEVEATLPLPGGDRELPIMITDRSFDAAGQLLYPSLDPTLLATPGVAGAFSAGVLGDVILVNGTPWPVAHVPAVRHRLRILNASNARRYRLALDPAPASDSPFVQVGSDGGLLGGPISLSAIELAPAERFDVVVDFGAYQPGTVVTLTNEFGEGAASAVMRFIVGDREQDDSSVPAVLSEVATLAAEDAVVTRTMQFTSGDVAGKMGWTINGMPFSPGRIAATVQLGTAEVWRLVSDFHHPVHLHLSPFQVLSRGIGGPGEFDAGWKDTIDLRPAEEATIAIPFDGYRGKYVFHCHNLEHEDMAMMGNFITT